ncbi:MAG: hypothetical protein CMH27_01505 [Micavibrio sp.]|nr:hypothetical protein [Micavibrio sp.]|tara:strand:- start:1854 stop:2108 length:255 start_codon:yes stop_codon:yes gene_type:complete
MKHNKARRNLLNNYIYKWVSLILGVFGFIVFIMMYLQYLGGKPGTLLHHPILIFVLIIPFLPSLCFLFLAKRARKNAASDISKS